MDKIIFSTRLAERRKECGYKTQYALAKEYNKRFPSTRKSKKEENAENASGILGTIKNYENANHTGFPRLDIVDNLCTILDCDVDYLLGNIECKKHDIQFTREYTGISESAINQLHKFTTYDQGTVRLAILDYLLCNTNFSIFLTDRIDSYYTKYDYFESGKKRYLEEGKTLHDLAGDNILKQIELQESGEFSSTIDRHKLAERESSRDAARFRVQKEFDDILDDLIEHFYKINNSEDEVAK